MYNFRWDLDLGIDKSACRRIPCDYLTCSEMLKLPWDVNINNDSQSRYEVNKCSKDTMIGEKSLWRK